MPDLIDDWCLRGQRACKTLVHRRGAHETDALKALQAEIYRDKVLRARAMTPAERLAEALELSNDIYTWMLDGAKQQWVPATAFNLDEVV